MRKIVHIVARASGPRGFLLYLRTGPNSMKIGILSDSHGKTARLGRAARELADCGAEALVHCGDIVTAESLAVLAESGLDIYAVAGNMDKHVAPLRSEARASGVHFHAEMIEVPLGDGQYLVALHGDDEQLLNELIDGGQFPFICHGHTHRPRDEQVRGVRVINPGALRHPRGTDAKTVALLDTDTGELDWIEIAD